MRSSTGTPAPGGTGMASPLRIASASLRGPARPSVPPGAVALSMPAGAPTLCAKAGPARPRDRARSVVRRIMGRAPGSGRDVLTVTALMDRPAPGLVPVPQGRAPAQAAGGRHARLAAGRDQGALRPGRRGEEEQPGREERAREGPRRQPGGRKPMRQIRSSRRRGARPSVRRHAKDVPEPSEITGFCLSRPTWRRRGSARVARSAPGRRDDG